MQEGPAQVHTWRRLRWALAAYAAIALMAGITLDGRLRQLVFLILALFAFRSWAAFKRASLL